MKVNLINIKSILQVRNPGTVILSGPEMGQIPFIENAWLTIEGGIISDFGTGSIPTGYKSGAEETIDCTDRYVLPAFVDSHTHIVFAASREEEFVMKIKGASYADIAAKGGGILNSARKLQSMSEDDLFEQSVKRAWEVIRSGTGAIEIKSGYGLTTADELKMLRVAKRIGRETPLLVKTTFLGAHAVPKETTKEKYIDQIIYEMIPAVAGENLASYIDVFCEEGFFSMEETIRIVERGKEFGLKPRIHANQLHRSGGVQAGVKTGAVSVDHLENIGAEEIAALQGSKTIPTALPGAAFFLNLPFPPARDILNAGLPLVIASDYNPGSAPSGNMPLMIALACIKMRMTPEEAINAATINAAHALEMEGQVGSVTKGKTANLIVTKPIPSIAYLPYSFGTNLIERVILQGKPVD